MTDKKTFVVVTMTGQVLHYQGESVRDVQLQLPDSLEVYDITEVNSQGDID